MSFIDPWQFLDILTLNKFPFIPLTYRSKLNFMKVYFKFLYSLLGVLFCSSFLTLHGWSQDFFSSDKTTLNPHQFELAKSPFASGGFGALYRILSQGKENPEFVAKVFYEPEEFIPNEAIKGELRLNKILREKELTHIQIFPGANNKIHVKTFVNGQELQDWIIKDRFFRPEESEARENLKKFWIRLIRAKLDLDDFQAYNIMYDEVKKRWEVVDGSFEGRIYKTYKESAKVYFDTAKVFFDCRYLKNKEQALLCETYMAGFKQDIIQEFFINEDPSLCLL